MSNRRTKAAIAMAGLAVASAQAPVIPTAVPVAGTNMCQVGPEWEYAPRWQIEGQLRMKVSAEECAMECEALGYCMGASWVQWDDGNHRCFLKAFEPPPAPAAYPCFKGTLEGKTVYALVMLNADDCASMQYVAGDAPTCKDEMNQFPENADALPFVGGGAVPPGEDPELLAVGPEPEIVDPVAPEEAIIEAPVPAEGPVPTVTPTVVVNGTYTQHPGFDYIPKEGDVQSVTVEDVGTGVVVADIKACEAECDSRPGCNAASYYGGEPASYPGGKNCWPKMLGIACKLPADADTDNALATLLIKQIEECEGEAPGPAVEAVMPTAAPTPASEPVLATPSEPSPPPSAPESGTTGSSSARDVPIVTDGAQASAWACAGAAVAAGAILLL